MTKPMTDERIDESLRIIQSTILSPTARAIVAGRLDEFVTEIRRLHDKNAKLQKVVEVVREVYECHELVEHINFAAKLEKALRELDKEPTPAVKPRRGCSCDSAGSFGCASPYCEYRSEEKKGVKDETKGSY